MFNITNSFEHPTRPGHTIYRFYTEERAVYFKQLLIEDNIWFEEDIDQEEDKTTYFFGIKNRDAKTVNQKNYLVNGTFRKPLISNKILRWLLPTIALTVMILAIIGYLKSKT